MSASKLASNLIIGNKKRADSFDKFLIKKCKEYHAFLVDKFTSSLNPRLLMKEIPKYLQMMLVELLSNQTPYKPITLSNFSYYH